MQAVRNAATTNNSYPRSVLILDEKKSILNADLVSEILKNEWDPIGVSDFAGASHEYDPYISGVVLMLQQNESTQSIFDYLWHAETVHMGLCGDRDRTQKIAEKLTVALRAQ